VGDVSEIRTRQLAGDRSALFGLCLPDLQQVAFHRTLFGRTISWPGQFATTIHLGSLVGDALSEFLFPLSFDFAPDGRVFVLDAGNGRIVSYDAEGDPITQWGNEGNFDFGSGVTSTDFAGSIAVDDDGFIYVADVGNRRIQKFAP
jgi:hypothetical protein